MAGDTEEEKEEGRWYGRKQLRPQSLEKKTEAPSSPPGTQELSIASFLASRDHARPATAAGPPRTRPTGRSLRRFRRRLVERMAEEASGANSWVERKEQTVTCITNTYEQSSSETRKGCWRRRNGLAKDIESFPVPAPLRTSHSSEHIVASKRLNPEAPAFTPRSSTGEDAWVSCLGVDFTFFHSDPFFAIWRNK